METNKKDAKELFSVKKDMYDACPDKVDGAYSYCEGYKKFLDSAKTEREAVREGIAMAEKAGYAEYRLGDALSAEGKYYFNNRDKCLYVFKIGTGDINRNGIRIAAAHIDSPRLDLKQVPLYEDSGMCFLKTHYYGGIKKYQWTTIPLALHGVIINAAGEKKEICVGEDEGDPLFCINDLLPHLASEQGKQPLSSAIKGEELNILSGSRPASDGDKDRIKLTLLRILNEKYGITEDDFISAELSAVPAFKARDVGFDRSMIGAYGHDDRVCAYPALTALLDSKDTEHTDICVLADKEEVGSDGNTGMQSRLIFDLIDEICSALGANSNIVRANSKCLSADVNGAFDPNFASVYEKRNSALISCGVTMSKYTGSRGKAGSNDASAEFIGWVRSLFAGHGVLWQTGELGKVDEGGGGTVAKYIANGNIDTVDLGVPVISMHAPWEIVSKVDVYSTYLAFCAFYA